MALTCWHFFKGLLALVIHVSSAGVQNLGCFLLTTPGDVVETKAEAQMWSIHARYKVCSLWEHLSRLGRLPLLCLGCALGWAETLGDN